MIGLKIEFTTVNSRCLLTEKVISVMAKFKKNRTIKYGNKTHTFEVGLSLNTSHTDYSGYGVHENKIRKAERRNRKLEEKRVIRGNWD